MNALKLLALLFLMNTAHATTYYVSPAGQDTNPGTELQPFRTIPKAHTVIIAGDTILVRGGLYNIPVEITLTKDGTETAPITLKAFGNEKVILDGQSMTSSGEGDKTKGKIFRMIDADWWIIEGFELKRAPAGGIILTAGSDNNVIRRLNIHDNGRLSSIDGTGLSVHDRSANNLIENNDSYLNRDAKGSGQGGDADGFAAVLVGPGNVFRGNRAWRNSDDGYDTFARTVTAPVKFENNYAFENGYNAAGGDAGGNGDGFKLGGGDFSGANIATNNLAWRNKQHGFDGNAAAYPNTLYNNVAWDNRMTNFVFTVPVADVLRNNLSYLSDGEAMNAAVDDQYNSWNPPTAAPDAADFASLDDLIARGARNADGSLQNSPFLHLAPGSDLIDKGINVGLPYMGSAPDIGAYETEGVTPPPCP